MRCAIVGSGRAGGSFAIALRRVGWTVDRIYSRGDGVAETAQGVNALLLCVPDDVIADVATAIEPGDAVVLHVAGSRTLEVLAPHSRRASIHPLMTLPDPERGAARLLDACPFAIAGDPVAARMAEALGGRPFEVPDEQRAVYHAAAAVASNHLVALVGQVERLAGTAGIPPALFGPLMEASLQNAIGSGAADAITGPASRGDWATVSAHLNAISAGRSDERRLYLTLAEQAAALAGRDFPEEMK